MLISAILFSCINYNFGMDTDWFPVTEKSTKVILSPLIKETGKQLVEIEF